MKLFGKIYTFMLRFNFHYILIVFALDLSANLLNYIKIWDESQGLYNISICSYVSQNVEWRILHNLKTHWLLRVGQPIFDFCHGQASFFSSPRPDRLWGPRRFLSNGYQGLLPSGKFGCGMMLINLHPEDGGSTDIRNVGILPQQFMASQSRRPRLEAD